MNLAFIDEQPGRPLALALAWLLLLACACGAWLLFQGAPPAAPAAGAPPPPPALRAVQVVLLFLMWSGLCAALLLPALAGAAYVHLRVARRFSGTVSPRLGAGLFALGCLLAWTGFAALLTLPHWGLHDAGLLDQSLGVRHPAAGLAVAAAGAWQWTPAKHACLQHCRMPLPGIVAEWRGGMAGPFWQGAEHGRTCLGCFWPQATIVVAGGPGNPLAVGAAGLLVLAELRMVEGHLAGCAAGLAMVAWSTLLLFP